MGGIASSEQTPITPAIVAADSDGYDKNELEQYFVAVKANGEPVDFSYSVRSIGKSIEKGQFNSTAQTSSFPVTQDIDIVFWPRWS